MLTLYVNKGENNLVFKPQGPSPKSKRSAEFSSQVKGNYKAFTKHLGRETGAHYIEL